MTSLAGCGSAGGGLEVVDQNARTTSFGNIEIEALVENSGSDVENGTLVGEVTLNEGRNYAETRDITVPSDTTQTYEIGIDIEITDSLSGSRFEYRAYIE